jgi:hypothetical protein
MEPKAILEQHRREPFRPFRIHTCDGATYDVARRELMLVGPTRMIVGLDPDGDGLPRRSLYLMPEDVTHLELLAAPGGRRKPGRRPATSADP